MPQSTFLEKLASLRSSSCEQLPTPELAVLSRAVARLRRAGMERQCLQIGETVPDFDFIDRDNRRRRLYDVLAEGPVVLNFFRGFWCAFCQTELEAYEKIRPELEALGCSYLAISPQKPETVPEVQGRVHFICDRDNRIASEFGIIYELVEAERALFESWGLKLEEVNGGDGWQLPIPATFIVTSDRRIAYEYVDVDFRDRCCPEQLIEELKPYVA